MICIVLFVISSSIKREANKVDRVKPVTAHKGVLQGGKIFKNDPKIFNKILKILLTKKKKFCELFQIFGALF
jgi:hypothetical protein